MAPAPIVLVPGFWLGAWAWDEVAGALRADGHDVSAVTLPGLESDDADRSAITLSDHVDAICGAVKAAAAPVVLAVHSGSGASGYAASDRVPELIAAMVYVDSGPATGGPEHGHLHGVQFRPVQSCGHRGLCLARRLRRAPRRYLDRPADKPLADVVAPPGARRDHRRRRAGSRPRRLAVLATSSRPMRLTGTRRSDGRASR